MAASNILADKRARTLRMVQSALLAALEVILTLLPIQVGTISLNFGLVPIVIAAVFLSPVHGMMIGAVSGFVTMAQVLSGQSAFYVFLIGVSPVMAALLCVIKTAAAGLIAGVGYRLMKAVCPLDVVNTMAAAVLCPVINTGIFALGMFTIFGDAMMADPVISTWSTGGLAALVFGALIGVNFFVELGLNVVVCPVLGRALRATKMFGAEKH